MDVAALVSLAHLFGIDLIQPVFLGEVLTDVVVESVDALLHVGVLFHAPVLVGEIAGEKLGRFSDERGDLSRFLTSFAVQDVRLGGLRVSLVDEDFFHEVLDVLDGRDLVDEFHFRRLDDEVGKFHGQILVFAAARLRRLENGVRDLLLVEEFDSSVTLQNLDDHSSLLPMSDYGSSGRNLSSLPKNARQSYHNNMLLSMAVRPQNLVFL